MVISHAVDNNNHWERGQAGTVGGVDRERERGEVQRGWKERAWKTIATDLVGGF